MTAGRGPPRADRSAARGARAAPLDARACRAPGASQSSLPTPTNGQAACFSVVRTSFVSDLWRAGSITKLGRPFKGGHEYVIYQQMNLVFGSVRLGEKDQSTGVLRLVFVCMNDDVAIEELQDVSSSTRLPLRHSSLLRMFGTFAQFSANASAKLSKFMR